VATLLKDAIKPNLVQTLENTPAIIHGGPFANIAQGTNSLIATKMGLSLSDYVITEAGFASELGAEKFLDIKARYGGLKPDAVVIVATIRALKYHGGVGLKELANPNPEAVKIGLENLDKHIENVQHFKIQPIVALNQFVTDSKAELEVLENHLKAKNVKYALNSSWAHGGDGALDFAKVVVETVNAGKSNFEPLYELDWSMEKKIETIATKLYGASGVEFTAKAKKDLRTIDELGLSKLPVCIAKTQNSLSDDKNLRNRPKDFVVNIREIEIASGAGFVVPISGEIMRMPGLPETPAAEAIDIDNEGNIVGLF
jgi:formate--tetrahydrofolate ligase